MSVLLPPAPPSLPPVGSVKREDKKSLNTRPLGRMRQRDGRAAKRTMNTVQHGCAASGVCAEAVRVRHAIATAKSQLSSPVCSRARRLLEYQAIWKLPAHHRQRTAARGRSLPSCQHKTEPLPTLVRGSSGPWRVLAWPRQDPKAREQQTRSLLTPIPIAAPTTCSSSPAGWQPPRRPRRQQRPAASRRNAFPERECRTAAPRWEASRSVARAGSPASSRVAPSRADCQWTRIRSGFRSWDRLSVTHWRICASLSTNLVAARGAAQIGPAFSSLSPLPQRCC